MLRWQRLTPSDSRIIVRLKNMGHYLWDASCYRFFSDKCRQGIHEFWTVINSIFKLRMSTNHDARTRPLVSIRQRGALHQIMFHFNAWVNQSKHWRVYIVFNRVTSSLNNKCTIVNTTSLVTVSHLDLRTSDPGKLVKCRLVRWVMLAALLKQTVEFMSRKDRMRLWIPISKVLCKLNVTLL